MSFRRFLPILMLTTACTLNTSEPTPPQTTDTHQIPEMSASYGAFSDGTRVEIFAALLGRGGFLRVGPGDTLQIAVNGLPIQTYERVIDKRVHTIAEVANPKDAEITITFARGSEGVVAKAQLAPDFAIKGTPPSAIRIGDVVSLDIEPHVDMTKFQGPLGPTLQHRIEVFGECVRGGSQKLEAGTTYPLALDTKKIVLDDPAGCEVDVRVRLDTTPAPFTARGTQKFGGGFEAANYRTFHAKLGS